MCRVDLEARILRHRRRVAILGAALLSAFYAVELAIDAPNLAAIFTVRTLWIAALAGCAALFRPGAPIPRAATDALATGACAISTVALVALSGGAGSGYFGFLFALPFCIVLLLPGAIACAAGCGVITTAAGAVLLVRAAASEAELVLWVSTAVGLSLLATYATWTSRALHLRELEAQRARAALAEELAANVRLLSRAERLAAVGRLASGVAHEVNNPLAVVKSSLAFVADRLGPGADPELAEAIGDAAHGAERIAQLVAGLKGFSVPGPERPCGAPVAAAVDEACRGASARLGPRVAVEIAVPPSLPPARICRGRLVQVLESLLHNASDAVAASAEGGGGIRVSASAADERVRIVVEDGGPGLAPHVLARLFEPFFTTKAPGRGTGLGLALAREYVAAAGGTLTATNREAGGARFTVEVPAGAAHDDAGCTPCPYGHAAPAAATVRLRVA